MKKLLALAIVAASFASCSNGEGDKKVEEVKTDSTSTMSATPMATDTTKMDTTKSMMKTDTTTMVKKDSTKK